MDATAYPGQLGFDHAQIAGPKARLGSYWLGQARGAQYSVGLLSFVSVVEKASTTSLSPPCLSTEVVG